MNPMNDGMMLVINKRYYDYDYDNGTIIMFDAEDEEPSCVSSPDADDKKFSGKQEKDKEALLESLSQSIETVPDDIIKPTSTATACDEMMEEDETVAVAAARSRSGKNSASNSESKVLVDADGNRLNPDEDNVSSVSWISSRSPKGLRRIPYAIQTCHSYTINKLAVQLTTLVDTATVVRQKEMEQHMREQQLQAHQAQLQYAMQHQQQQQQLAMQHQQQHHHHHQQQQPYAHQYGPRVPVHPHSHHPYAHPHAPYVAPHGHGHPPPHPPPPNGAYRRGPPPVHASPPSAAEHGGHPHYAYMSQRPRFIPKSSKAGHTPSHSHEAMQHHGHNIVYGDAMRL
mmetsp:Transcript_48896/g.81159  ORF Transcript_48896/g.81159 Transcript_48896/m.81159 type:complete len:341 (-) Transcript_48896:832-1854(-)